MTQARLCPLVLLGALLASPVVMAAPSGASALVPPPVVPPPIPTSAGTGPVSAPTPSPAAKSVAPAKSPAPAVAPPPAKSAASPAAAPAAPALTKVPAPVVAPPKPSPFIPLGQQTGPAGAARVAEARDHFNRGLQHFKDGGLEAALAEFLRAYELAPSYRLHFNVAQVHYELRNYVEAKRSFQRYLAEADAELPSDRRALVEAELQKLDRLVAQFSVRTSVPGVQIAVDGVPAGLVAQGNLVLVNTNPGVRRVSAAKLGFLPASMVVTVTPGERRRLVFELAPVALASAPLAPGTNAAVSGLGSNGVMAGAGDADLTASAPSQPRMKLWVAVASTATLAAATGVFALVTRNAHADFDRQLARVPNDRQTVDDARSRMSRYAIVADVLAGATALAAGVSIYFAFTESADSERRIATAGWQGRF
jgi:hypothetical protein